MKIQILIMVGVILSLNLVVGVSDNLLEHNYTCIFYDNGNCMMAKDENGNIGICTPDVNVSVCKANEDSQQESDDFWKAKLSPEEYWAYKNPEEYIKKLQRESSWWYKFKLKFKELFNIGSKDKMILFILSTVLGIGIVLLICDCKDCEKTKEYFDLLNKRREK